MYRYVEICRCLKKSNLSERCESGRSRKMSDMKESEPLCEGLKKRKISACPLCLCLNVGSLKILPPEEERGNIAVPPHRDVGEMM